MVHRKHQNKKNEKFINTLIHDGFKCIRTKKGFKIMKDSGPIIVYHSGGEHAYRPLVERLQEYYNYFELKK